MVMAMHTDGVEKRASRAARLLRCTALPVAVAAVLAGCSGLDAVERDLDRLDLPGELVEIAETRGGSESALFGDYPQIVRYYASAETPADMCEQLRAWSAGRELAEVDFSGGDESRCRFSGSGDSRSVLIDVTATPTEIVFRQPLKEDLPVGTEYGAVILVEVTHF